ncbi:hypothetical protein [Arthrobacter sp. M2012083]|uniref:hypothetical protein n=1 Tax=Arthrobacter sp. M2012083 TaxID=1197706 RepID=UPI0002FF5CDB|nr:hypothetical protein [Arthrobacter sp. M2012083]
MTAAVLLGIMARRWYILAIGIVVGLASLGAVRSSEPVYWTKAEVTFVAPDRKPAYWIPGDDYASLVDFAAMVERRVNYNSASVDLTLSSGTLYGAGVRHGYSVNLLNSGGQWAKSFRWPVLSVQVVDSSAQKVKEVLNGVIDQINAASLALQTEAGVQQDLITTLTSPSSPEIVFGGGTQINRVKGAVFWVGIAATLSTLAAVIIDARPRRRRTPKKQTTRVQQAEEKSHVPG